jgi:hypothetical protein
LVVCSFLIGIKTLFVFFASFPFACFVFSMGI